MVCYDYHLQSPARLTQTPSHAQDILLFHRRGLHAYSCNPFSALGEL